MPLLHFKDKQWQVILKSRADFQFKALNVADLKPNPVPKSLFVAPNDRHSLISVMQHKPSPPSLSIMNV